jgi:hypothetical protein
MPPNQYALTEPGILALLARLEDPAQLNVEIANIAAGVVAADEKASLVPIPPEQIFDFVPPPPFLTAFPTIGLQEMVSAIKDDTGSSATGEHRFGIVLFCSDPDQHILAWQLRRYMQAITRVCLAGRTLGTSAPLAGWGTGPDGIDWGPTLSSVATPQTWMSFAVFRMWARREEI